MRSIPKLIFAFFILISSSALWAADLPDFRSLVKQAAPAVVNISTEQKVNSQSTPFMGPNGEEIPEIFRHFFRMPESGQGDGPKRRSPQSLGSGFIISDDGYLLTNHHVIADADKVIVRLADRRELEAEVIGSDKRSDVALLKIEANDLPTVALGKSEAVEVGEWVLATETYVPFIQTDVAINPGNSGGPLFNLEGEVVGINSQIYTRSGGFMGLSFAIPIDVAMDVAEQLRTDGFVTRGWLGVIIQEVNRDLAESFGLDKPAGALVAKVLPDSPAQKAGLQAGDVILRFEGFEVIRSADLPHHVGRVKPGKKATVDIVRSGKAKTLRVEIGTLPTPEQLAGVGKTKPELDTGNRLGVDVSELDKQRKDKWQVEQGVVVRRVMPGAASEAGLMVGDVITMLNGKQIASVTDFQRVSKALPSGRSLPMRIVRRGSPMFIPIKIAK